SSLDFWSSVDHDFEFAHFADGEVDAFAPQTTRLDAAEGYVLSAEIGAFVDHHATHPQGARQTPDDGVVVGEEAGLQAIGAVLDVADNLVDIGEGANGEDRPERLLGEEVAPGRDLVEQRRHDIGLVPDPAIDEACAIADSSLDAALDFAGGGGINHRAHIRLFAGRIAEARGSNPVGEGSDEAGVDVAMDIDALGGGAALAGDLEPVADGGLGGAIEVG